MKTIFSIWWTLALLLSAGCGSAPENTGRKSDMTGKDEMSKVEDMKKTEKQKADSVKAYWENKMKQPGTGDEPN